MFSPKHGQAPFGDSSKGLQSQCRVAYCDCVVYSVYSCSRPAALGSCMHEMNTSKWCKLTTVVLQYFHGSCIHMKLEILYVLYAV